MQIIMEGAEYAIRSWGNGLAYALENKCECLSVFVQEDDAATFRMEQEACELVHPEWSPDQVGAWLWDAYGECAAPDE